MHRRRGAALNPGPGQLLPPSFPTTHMWCDRLGTCRFPASSATAFRFDRSRDAVVSTPPYAARTTIANNPASPATARVFMTVLHHAGQRELLSYIGNVSTLDDAVAAFNPLCACPIPNASRLASQAR